MIRVRLKYQVEAGPDTDRSRDFEKPWFNTMLAVLWFTVHKLLIKYVIVIEYCSYK